MKWKLFFTGWMGLFIACLFGSVFFKAITQPPAVVDSWSILTVAGYFLTIGAASFFTIFGAVTIYYSVEDVLDL